MSWPQVTIDSWKDFAYRAEQSIQDEQSHSIFGRAHVYRGQSNAAWNLETTLQRLGQEYSLSETQLARIEDTILESFREQAHLYMDTASLELSDDLLWWTIMQHYGVPTRLLDWTQSPFVAAYFAVRSNHKVDGAIWRFNRDWLHQRNHPAVDTESQGLSRKLLDQLPHSAVFHFATNRPQERIVAQQGSFTVASNSTTYQHEELEHSLGKGVAVKLGKWIIPSNLKPTFLSMLDAMNISARTLFPGLEGFGRSVAETANLRSMEITTRRAGIRVIQAIKQSENPKSA